MKTIDVTLTLILLYLFFSVYVGLSYNFHNRIISLMSQEDTVKNRDVIKFLLFAPFSLYIYVCEKVFMFFLNIDKKINNKYFIRIHNWLDKDIKKNKDR